MNDLKTDYEVQSVNISFADPLEKAALIVLTHELLNYSARRCRGLLEGLSYSYAFVTVLGSEKN